MQMQKVLYCLYFLLKTTCRHFGAVIFTQEGNINLETTQRLKTSNLGMTGEIDFD